MVFLCIPAINSFGLGFQRWEIAPPIFTLKVEIVWKIVESCYKVDAKIDRQAFEFCIGYFIHVIIGYSCRLWKRALGY
jgi:hypothetical protein